MQCMNFALGAERTSIMVKRVPVSWTVDAERGYLPSASENSGCSFCLVEPSEMRQVARRESAPPFWSGHFRIAVTLGV